MQIAILSPGSSILSCWIKVLNALNPGPPGGIDINLVGVQRLGVSGNKTTFMTEVKTTWGTFYSEQEFLILD